jgi:hypothetical protein
MHVNDDSFTPELARFLFDLFVMNGPSSTPPVLPSINLNDQPKIALIFLLRQSDQTLAEKGLTRQQIEARLKEIKEEKTASNTRAGKIRSVPLQYIPGARCRKNLC